MIGIGRVFFNSSARVLRNSGRYGLHTTRSQRLSGACLRSNTSHASRLTGRLNYVGYLAGGLVAAYGVYSQAVIAEESSVEELIAEADKLYGLNKFEDIYNLLISSKSLKSDEILWRLARATYEKAKAAATDAEKKVLYREALDYAEEALSINENNFAVHKWMSILIDYVYGYEGTKARISQSFNVKHHMERACQLNPTDGTSWYLLGYWCFTVANIPWYQRKIAAVVFATPPSSSFEEALGHFLHAEEISPNFYRLSSLWSPLGVTV
ncbi:regulator of microtubule dynamics protein 1-like isoform X2 [Macrobrachium rosenbergii]|uniref:regulator of microtubule dynamics protein 1-like isoform X2 n=1 Tax=Macrobrachium rosenbergii TaxID=79674 RepID=UPI0034D54E95